MMKYVMGGMLLTILLQPGLQAQKAPPAGNANPAAAALPGSDEYIIGPEDVLAINVWKEPELTNRAVVRPDGKIGMPLLNDIQASGLSPRGLQENITEGLKKFISGPTVSVIVAEIHSQVVYVTGSVGKPGPYILGTPTKVMELLIRAGGVTEFAKSEDIQIVRIEGNTTRRFKFNFKQFVDGRDYQQNIEIRRGDIVIVP